MPNQQLVDYIKGQLAAGVVKTDLEKAIASAGWSAQDAAAAFAAAEGKLPPPPAPPHAPSQPQPVQQPIEIGGMVIGKTGGGSAGNNTGIGAFNTPRGPWRWWMFGIVAVLALAGAALWHFLPAARALIFDNLLARPVPATQQETPQPATSTLQSYFNAQYGFSLVYVPEGPYPSIDDPQAGTFRTSGFGSLHPFANPPIAYLQQGDTAQTEGYLSINVSTSTADIARCSQPGAVYPANSGTHITATSTVVIGQVSFLRSDRSDGGSVAGFGRDYSTIHNGICYDIELSSFPSACVNSGCDNRFWSAQTERTLLEKLDAVAQTFRFMQ